jgi:glycosyltransferase involved in cell wall biosynthesis
MEPSSVIVCTYNRLTYLKKCVDSLLSLQYPLYEIVIVNDGSTDGTKQFLELLTDERVRVIHHDSNRGLSHARNTGIKYARYDILAFTDDDCIVSPDWLIELSKGFLDEYIGIVMGQAFYVSEDYRGYFPERMVSNIGARWPMGLCVAYRRSVFEKCGGFDDYFFWYNNEDSEMAIRAVSLGFRFNRALDATVYHQKMNWTIPSLLASSRNISVWPVLKKRYPNHYETFSPPIQFGVVVGMKDYLYILLMPIFIPLLFVRYVSHGKRDWKIFFVKWPVCLIMRRYYLYREALRSGCLMF